MGCGSSTAPLRWDIKGSFRDQMPSADQLLSGGNATMQALGTLCLAQSTLVQAFYLAPCSAGKGTKGEEAGRVQF